MAKGVPCSGLEVSMLVVLGFPGVRGDWGPEIPQSGERFWSS